MTTQEAYSAYDDFIDETSGDGSGAVTILDVPYALSDILYKVDPIAYRCGFNDWADSEDIDIDELEGNLYRH